MAFLLKRPFIFIIISVVCIVVILQFLSLPPVEPAIVLTPSLTDDDIVMLEDTTLTAVMENTDTQIHTVEYRVVGIFSSEQIEFSFKNGTLLPKPVWNGHNYTLIYPIKRVMDVGNQWSVSLLLKGLDPEGDFARYTIFLEAWADNVLSERKSIQLTVRHDS